MISVLVVEDSPVARELLVHILSSGDMRVVGTAADGLQAVEMVRRLRPDVVTMDIVMPRMDGLEATRRIMETSPVPIVIVSGIWNPTEVQTTFRAMEAGALATVRRPPGPGNPEYRKLAEELRRTVRLMAEVKVVRRWSRGAKPPANRLPAVSCPPWCALSIVAIGASTGGPPVLHTILGGLPPDFPLPVVVVQHLAAGFLPGMMEWLGQSCPLPLHIAVDGEVLAPGHVYFAPDDIHMEVTRHGTICLSRGAPEHGARPSVCCLFRSVAASYGGRAAALLLTGMGEDGADGMLLLRQKGAVTIAQSRETCAVFGMPAAALQLGAALHELAPERMPAFLRELTMKHPEERNIQ
ncbi:chemotaxis-specific protein-glutamate methyltransferase CheB [Geobacter sp. DSM 9736]|uniref:chemotaxis-specific protein-glutamate methyltransferase CheB n=1 Tax=Geobacter sp. DSM 9736 TaxID=1277350 RepID=UPI000B50CA23|nr:chemotaxis-specific protein-glutamate methyltransferase CheB [Geobacter sp. DSM 9736]SNB44743.1 two-component system, chemotaxis family, response regulator CheB [Geobacter sp. DSM 9736]